MKKTIYILLLLLPLQVFAKSFLVSNIALPSISIQNLNPFPCNDKCLSKFVKERMIFSFLAFVDPELQSDKELKSVNLEKEKEKYLSKDEKVLPPTQKNKLKIALLLPHKKIGKYATSTTNATLAYLISKNYPFEVKSYKIENETQEEFAKTLAKIQSDKFYYVIAPVTQNGEKEIAKINTDIVIYFPTINKKDASSNADNFYYGGIDYKAQSEKLLAHAQNKLYIFNDSSLVGEQISSYQERYFKNTNPNASVTKYAIPEKTTNLQNQLKDNLRMNGSSVFVNTPIVKSSMIMSQLTLNDIKADNILSLQTNYTPLLFSMTQQNDRKSMILANSITKNSDTLVEINSLLDNDISYDWINYTTTVGVDYFAHLIYAQSREYDIEISNNQMLYPIELTTPSFSKFVPMGMEYNE